MTIEVVPNSTACTPSHIELVIHLLTLEVFAGYYMQSEGALYEKQVMEECDIIERQITALDVIDPTVSKIARMNNGPHLNETLNRIRTFKKTLSNGTESDQRIAFNCIWCLTPYKVNLLQRIGLTDWPKISFTSEALDYWPSTTKWRGYVCPHYLMRGDVDKRIKADFRTRTIAIVADIRRSQDLMTYAASPSDFSKRIITLSNFAKETLTRYGGCFDKFTGDGFIGYFNEAMCASMEKDYKKCFFSFCKDVLAFAHDHFEEWKDNVKKLPRVEVGLCIGADIGVVDLTNDDNHLIAVGDAIVWASRMASEASAGEVLVNNLLRKELSATRLLEKKECKTKSGEEFSAFKLTINSPVRNEGLGFNHI